MSSFYEAFGLRIRSSLVLPDLIEGSGPEYDVEIREEPVRKTLEQAKITGVRFQLSPTQTLLAVNSVARYLVTEGKVISFEREPGASDKEVSLFLFGSAIAGLLHQRRALVLHGSAIEFNGQGIIFAGVSGQGKSTLAAGLHQKGHPLITDDLCVIRPDEAGCWRIQPGIPRFKLWPDSLLRLGIPGEELPRIREQLNKRGLSLGGEAFSRVSSPAAKLYLLREGNTLDLRLETMRGAEKFDILNRMTYRQRLREGADPGEFDFQNYLGAARQLEVKSIYRPKKPFLLDELIALIEGDLKA